MGQFFTLAGLIFLLKNLFTLSTPTYFTGTLTNGSATVTNLSSTAGLASGQFISGVGVPQNATIVSVNTVNSTLVMSAAATASTPGGQSTALVAWGTVGQSIPLIVHLLTGQVPQSALTNWSQLTEASYDGYVPQVASYPFVESTPDNLNVAASCQTMTFAPTDYIVPNTITGIAWTYTPPGASGPVLVAVEPLAAPVNLSVVGDLIRVIPVLAFRTNELGVIPSPLLV